MATTGSATSSTNVLTTLSAGSGIDSKALATNLVEAERAPQKAVLDRRITESEARISGYSGVMYAVNALKDAFTALQEKPKLNVTTATSSQTTALKASSTTAAAVGTHEVEVLAIARAQRSMTAGFAANSDALNGGAAFSMRIALTSGASKTITVGTATPAGVVSAINSAGAGVRAQLVNTGDAVNPVRIVLTASNTGIANGFSVTTDNGAGSAVAGLTFNQAQPAEDARIGVNGLILNRATNKITDAISGVTLELSGLTSGPAQLDISRDTSAVKGKITALVSAFNDVKSVLNVVSDKDSTVEKLGGSLASDGLVRRLREQIRSIMTRDSSSPSNGVNALRDIGITIQRDGTFQTDESKLDDALANRFDDVVKMFTADATIQPSGGIAKRGLAGDAAFQLKGILGTKGPIMPASDGASADVTRYKDELTRLEGRMTTLLDRYTKQFSVMDELVGRVNSQKSGLKSSFDGLMAMYTNK